MLRREEEEKLRIRSCAASCMIENSNCSQTECRLWIDYTPDNNCTLVAVEKNGPMTLQQIAERHHISVVRAKQILDATLVKLKKRLKRTQTI